MLLSIRSLVVDRSRALVISAGGESRAAGVV
jgi:hypothetical protein